MGGVSVRSYVRDGKIKLIVNLDGTLSEIVLASSLSVSKIFEDALLFVIHKIVSDSTTQLLRDEIYIAKKMFGDDIPRSVIGYLSRKYGVPKRKIRKIIKRMNIQRDNALIHLLEAGDDGLVISYLESDKKISNPLWGLHIAKKFVELTKNEK